MSTKTSTRATAVAALLLAANAVLARPNGGRKDDIAPVLAAGGYTYGRAKQKVEMVATPSCTLPELPWKVDGAVGATLAGVPWICGGDQCASFDVDSFSWTSNAAQLDVMRKFAAAAPLSDTRLWIAGGYDERTDTSLSSSVVLDTESGDVLVGPPLPGPPHKHSLLRLNETHFFLGGSYAPVRDWIFDASKEEFVEISDRFPSHQDRRDYFAGVARRSDGDQVVVVTGGVADPSSTYILDLATLRWRRTSAGFPPATFGGASSPDGVGSFLALGGFSVQGQPRPGYSQEVFGFDADEERWSPMGVKLSQPNGLFVAFPVPSPLYQACTSPQ